MTHKRARWRWPARLALAGGLLALLATPAGVQAHGHAGGGPGVGPGHVAPEVPAEYESLKNPATSAMDAKRGARYYFRICAKCHGDEGLGNGRESDPIVLSDDSYMSTRTDGQLFYVIKFGAGGDSRMKAFGKGSKAGLSDREIWQTVTYIRALSF